MSMRTRAADSALRGRIERRAVLAGLIALSAVSGARVSYGVLLPSLAGALDESMFALGLPFVMHWIVFTLTAPIAWRLFAAWGARVLFVAGSASTGLGLGLLPLAGNVVQATLIYGVLVGFGAHGIGQMTANHPVMLLSRPRPRGRNFGIVACGATVGTAVFPALTALLLSATTWTLAAVALAGAILLTGLTAFALVPREYASARRDRVSVGRSDGGLPAKSTTPWRDTTFWLLAGAFLVALMVQTAVPILLPSWALTLGMTAEQLAAAFLVMGFAGVAGRVAMTSSRRVRHRQLWVCVPVTAVAGVGFLVAVLWPSGWGFYVAAALLGFATPVFGALFALATLACYSPARYAQVSGTLLIFVGIGAAGAGVLPGLVLDHSIPFSVVWTFLAIALVASTALFIAAESSSPVYRAYRAEIGIPTGRGSDQTARGDDPLRASL